MHNTLPKGMLLDLDDTILAFDSVADRSWEQTLNEFRHEFYPIAPQTLHKSIKATAKDFWSEPSRRCAWRLNLEAARKQIVSDAMNTLQINDAELASKIVRTYGIVRTQLIQSVSRAIETLDYLREHRVPLILVTNGDAKGQRYKIQQFQLQQFFKCILIEGECGFGKPDERVYLRALTELNLPPEDVWMVGDNLKCDVVGPQKLGIRGIWVDYRGVGLPKDCTSTPYRIVTSLSDILL